MGGIIRKRWLSADRVAQPGFQIFMTSAPSSANNLRQYGALFISANSKTFTPANALSLISPSLFKSSIQHWKRFGLGFQELRFEVF
jgi:hypothetical protein